MRRLTFFFKLYIFFREQAGVQVEEIWSFTSQDSWSVSCSCNFTLPFLYLEIHETYFLSPPSPSTSLHLTFYLPHFAINLLFILSNELIRVS